MDFNHLTYQISRLKGLNFSFKNIIITAKVVDNDLILSSEVFSEENYIPQKVRLCIKETKLMPYEKLCIEETLFQVKYFQNILFSKNSSTLPVQIEFFYENVCKWKNILDDLSQQDLVFIYQK